MPHSNLTTAIAELPCPIGIGSGAWLDPKIVNADCLSELAAMLVGRKSIGIEKDPKHFATAVERISRELLQPSAFRAVDGFSVFKTQNPTTSDFKSLVVKPKDVALGSNIPN